ncbi:dUTP diphosphatase [Cohnella yongneupensis]|uniref:dUTP diphosphatase n=1 Tax=Cohnella yongneupensis TaxID=425006 RepID=A0ABW0QV47_9BACL
MSTTLEQLYEMQKSLDARIIKEKNLEGVDLLPNTVLALQVEIAELANEWRGFKHWSNDREPRTTRFREQLVTNDDGEQYIDQVPYNPLLEEYADCVSFFLQIARQKDLIEYMYVHEDAIEETREKGLDGGIGGALLECKYWLSKFYMETATDDKIEKVFGYRINDPAFNPEITRYNTVEEAVNAIDEATK